MKKIGFIGRINGGSNGERTAAKRNDSPGHIYMTNRSNDSRRRAPKTYGVKPCRDKEEFFSNTDIIVLAFKPKDAAESIENIREYVKDQLVISVIAGLTIHTIQQYFGRKLTIIRAMPNTSAFSNRRPVFRKLRGE